MVHHSKYLEVQKKAACYNGYPIYCNICINHNSRVSVYVIYGIYICIFKYIYLQCNLYLNSSTKSVHIYTVAKVTFAFGIEDTMSANAGS